MGCTNLFRHRIERRRIDRPGWSGSNYRRRAASGLPASTQRSRRGGKWGRCAAPSCFLQPWVRPPLSEGNLNQDQDHRKVKANKWQKIQQSWKLSKIRTTLSLQLTACPNRGWVDPLHPKGQTIRDGNVFRSGRRLQKWRSSPVSDRRSELGGEKLKTSSRTRCHYNLKYLFP